MIDIVDAVGSAGIETYTYDALNRLTKAVGAWGSIQYGYDSVGNRLWMNDGTNRSYSYATYNKLTSDGIWDYDYDENGNVAWKNSTAERYHYVYNSFGQMTSVRKSTDGGSSWSTVATYSYDANGQRSRTVEGSVATNFVYQGIDTECQFGSDGKVNKYIYAAGQLQLRTCSATESYAYISDALGSSRLVLKNGNADAANKVFSAVTYKPFGAVYSPTGSDRITFAGETTDDTTGLVYLSARYYDPAIGRFYALDPEMGSLSVPQTLNRFVYCVNSPLIHTDPTGRALNFIAAGIGAVVGGVIGGVVTYIATGGDLQATGAAILGGMVTGGLAGLTMGASLLPESFGLVGTGMVVGAGAGAAGGAVEQGLLAGARSNWDLGKIGEGAIKGAIMGGATGFISGGLSNKFLGFSKMIPAETKSAYKYFLGEAEGLFQGMKTANYATKEGIAEGVNIMSKTTADDVALVTTVTGLTSYGRVWSVPIGLGVKAFTNYEIDTYQRIIKGATR